MTDLSDRSLLIVAADGTAVWVRLPTKNLAPLDQEELLARLTPGLQAGAEKLKTLIPAYGLEGAAALTIKSMVHRLSSVEMSPDFVGSILDDIVELAAKVYALRSREFALAKTPVGDFRQIIYLFTPDGYGIGTSPDRGFFVTEDDQDKLDQAVYYAGIDEGPVVGLWPKNAVVVAMADTSPQTLH